MIPAVFWHLAHGAEVARSPVPCPGLCRLRRPVDDVREKDDEEESQRSLRRLYRGCAVAVPLESTKSLGYFDDCSHSLFVCIGVLQRKRAVGGC